MGHKSFLIVLARAGYGSRGIIYLIIGALTIFTAVQGRGDAKGSKEAILVVDSLPAGNILLILLVVGLIGYSGWRFFQSVLDADDHGTDFKGLAIRGGLLVSTFTHLSFAYFAFRLATAGGSAGGGGGPDDLTAKLMQQPWGRWLVAAVGVGIVIAGIAQVIKGVKAKYRKYMRFGENMNHWAHPVCRFGLVARGVVFGIIGNFFLYAAWTFDPDKARGLSGALAALEEQMFGTFLLLGVAGGLFAFGIYSMLEMIYRRIHPLSSPAG